MRKLGRFEPMLGRAEIGGIQIDVKSRDDIPAILLGLQGLYLNEAVREAVFELLLDRFGEDRDLTVGRPGMELWDGSRARGAEARPWLRLRPAS